MPANIQPKPPPSLCSQPRKNSKYQLLGNNWKDIVETFSCPLLWDTSNYSLTSSRTPHTISTQVVGLLLAAADDDSSTVLATQCTNSCCGFITREDGNDTLTSPPPSPRDYLVVMLHAYHISLHIVLVGIYQSIYWSLKLLPRGLRESGLKYPCMLHICTDVHRYPLLLSSVVVGGNWSHNR